MNKLINIFKKVINLGSRKFVFKKPQLEEILIYREDGKKIIFQLFNKENIKVLDPIIEINIYVLISVIFKCFKSL